MPVTFRPRTFLSVLIVCVLLSGCYRDKFSQTFKIISTKNTDPVFFPFFLSEKTMIINTEQNNEIEGHYLKIEKVINDSTLQINLPENFYLNNTNISNWMLGWPTGVAYYDAGNENLSTIKFINAEKGIIGIGKLLRGNTAPKQGSRVVFWNRAPSGYNDIPMGKLVEPKWWKNFGGESIEFGSIIFDSTSYKWIMYVQEVDTNYVRIYAATSPNLIQWQAANNGKPIFTPTDFNKTPWAGMANDGVTPQTPRLYSVIKHKGHWYFFLSGYNSKNKRQIGLITTTNPIGGPFNIYPVPVVTAGVNGCDVNGCFYPKVCAKGEGFIMYYDGVDEQGTETVCLAESNDLLHWEKYNGNPVISNHYGWRSGVYTSEPNYVTAKNDTVWLMCGGYKKYNTEFNKEDSIYNRSPIDKSIFSDSETDKGKYLSGNVMDAALGAFISTDGGYTFHPHINNPVWVINYSDTLQNDHCGGDFMPINSNGNNYIIYQAKSETLKRYNILLRKK